MRTKTPCKYNNILIQLQHLDLSPYLRTSHISDSSLCSMPDPPQNVQEEVSYITSVVIICTT